MHEHFDTTVISSGSNDPRSVALRADLERSRRAMDSDRVVWILPVERHARAAVLSVATQHGDRTVPFRPGRDGVHPESYSALARAVWNPA